MRRFGDFAPKGVIPATLLSFDDDYAIDEADSRRHLRDVAATRGLSAVCVNGHASEVHACTIDEQRRILDFSLDEVGDALPLISGVYADGSHQAARIADRGYVIVNGEIAFEGKSAAELADNELVKQYYLGA